MRLTDRLKITAKQLRAAVLLGSLLLISLSTIVLLGWNATNDCLIYLFSKSSPIEFNTALGLLIASIAVLMFSLSKVVIPTALSVALFILGIASFIEAAFSLNLGINSLLYSSVESKYELRMSVNTAICFITSSVALLVSKRGIKAVQLQGVLGTMVVGFAIVAIANTCTPGSTSVYEKWTCMPLQTSIFFIILGLSITCLSWLDEHYVKVFNRIQSKPFIIGYSIVLAITIFFVDLGLSTAISASVLYVLFILCAWFIPKKQIAFRFATIATVLVIVGLLVGPEIDNMANGITNRSYSIVVFWVVALLIENVKYKEKQLKNVNSKLDIKLAELKEKNKELEQFAYIASHDLQEPLQTVLRVIDILEQDFAEKCGPEASQLLKFISGASDRMNELIKGLLEYSRLGSNRKMSKTNLNRLLNTIKADMGSRITNTAAVVEVANLPVIAAYKAELRVLCQNLISNAIKFIAQGVVPHIVIDAVEDGPYWHFTVKDNGIGIAKKNQKKIFSIFQRLHNKEEYEGTGIGLSHCQKIVHLHGGKIWVESEEGEGSTFHFTIPDFLRKYRQKS